METQAELANFTSSDHLAAALKQVIHGQYASLSLNPDIARICECAAVAPVKYTGRFAQALQLHEQFRQYSDLEAAQECINIYKALLGKPENYLDIPAVEHRLSPRPATTLCARPKRCHILIHLAHIFEDRFRHAENPSDLDFAIEYGRDALLLCGAEQLVCPTVSVLYANIMILCADNASNLDWIAMAEILCRGTILICSTKHPLKATALSYLGWILFRRFWVTGSAASLDEAIKQQRLALTELHPSQALEKHRHLRYLGSYLFRQYEALNDPGVLEESLTFTAEALRHCTTTHIDRSKSVHDMLRAIVRKCMHSHSLEDLDHGVNIGRAALQSRYSHGTPPVHMLEMVANILSLRHQLNPSDGHDIDEAVHLYREIMKRSPQSSIESHGRHLDQIALALYLQYGWTGDLCNLDEAVHLFRRAADASQGYFHLLSARRVVSSLAEALMCRFAEIGNIEDLNEALDWDMRALAGSPSESDYSGMALLKVSHLCTRYEVLQDMADLNEAVELSRSLLNLLSPNHVYRVEITHYMTKALLLRGRDTNNTSDITMVIQELTPMIEILSSMHHGPETFRILALGHQIRFRQTRDPDEAIRALEVMHAMLALAPPGRRYRHQCLISSAELYLEHGTSYRDLALALTRLQDALSDNHRDVRSRIQGTMSVLSIIELSHKDIFTVEHTIQEQLLDVYNSIVSLLPRVAFFGLHLRTRLTSLRVGQAVALTGASHALNLSFPEKSLEILEQGRAVFWTHSLRLRSPFDSVPSELRDRLLFLARKLEQTSPSGQDSREMESEAARRRQQSEDFNALLEEVRMLPGFDRFLLPDQCSTLMKAAENGPVVVLLSSRLACHAIIIKPSQDLMSIPLKELTEEWLVASCTSWRSAATEARSKLKERLQVSKSAKRPKSKHTHADEILRRLWVHVVLPIFNALEIKASTGHNRPRLWWCPTGQFAHLPIHAAGAGGVWCSDYVVSSYTPTLSSLIGARASSAPLRKLDVRALVAAVPRSDMPQWSDLLSTREEVSAVRAVLPAGVEISTASENGFSTRAYGEAITSETLLENLPRATILHLACHGHQDPEDPLKSGFVMQDQMLTIEKLMPTPVPHAFMAFLSACETAKGDKNQPDQVVHLAATLLFAGFKSIIATLWSMEDVDGPLIAKSVYGGIFGSDAEYIHPDDVAYALDEGVQKLRHAHPDPSRWAPYIHLGI